MAGAQLLANQVTLVPFYFLGAYVAKLACPTEGQYVEDLPSEPSHLVVTGVSVLSVPRGYLCHHLRILSQVVVGHLSNHQSLDLLAYNILQ